MECRADRWEMTYKVLREYVKEHGEARVPKLFIR